MSQIIPSKSVPSLSRIGGLVVKLAVAICSRATSASPGFDSRPMQLLSFCFFCPSPLTTTSFYTCQAHIFLHRKSIYDLQFDVSSATRSTIWPISNGWLGVASPVLSASRWGAHSFSSPTSLNKAHLVGQAS
jgi:hypothetical protein